MQTKSFNDPYFDTKECVHRLYMTYKQHKNLIIAFDYDDTIFDFHKKGYKYPKIIKILKDCIDLGFTLILFTAKETDKELTDIDAYLLHEFDIGVDYINESPVINKSQKPYYNLLLDDKAGLGQAYEILRLTIRRIRNKQL